MGKSTSPFRDGHGWLSDPMLDVLRVLARERCISRSRHDASAIAGLQRRCLVSVAKGFVELTEIGRLAAAGLELRDRRAMLFNPMRADRTGGAPLAVAHG